MKYVYYIEIDEYSDLNWIIREIIVKKMKESIYNQNVFHKNDYFHRSMIKWSDQTLICS